MDIPIITGGKSVEREIAFRSAKNVFNSLTNLGHKPLIIDLIDDDFVNKIKNYKFVFNVVHGDYGEDGRLSSLLDILGIDYTCSSPETCVATYDKFIFYSIFKNYIQMPKTILTNKLISPPFQYPFVIKPRKSGSSKGVYIIHNENEYKFYLEKDLREFQEVLVQEYINGREITISHIQKNNEFILLPILEIIPKKEFYDYEAKYTNGLTELIPQLNSTEKIMREVHKITTQVMRTLVFKDMFRIDAILKDDMIYVLEINTVPGLTELSDLPRSATAAGINFDSLVDILVKNHIKEPSKVSF